jgi:hypothetical protein
MMNFRFNLLSSKTRLVLGLGLLLLPALACGLVNPQYRLKNEVRLAVYDYERQVRGPVDDLVIYFKRNEPRVKFEGQYETGGRTVWLYDLGVADYFSLRSPRDTYLYIQAIDFSNDYQTATATVYRGDGDGYTGRRLSLSRGQDETWTVTEEMLIPDNASAGTE